MASGDSPVVLRVKRKRTRDPVEALAIRCKTRKLDEDSQEQASSRLVFQLCGTLEDGKPGSIVWDVVRDYVKTRRDLVKFNPLSKLTLSDCKAEQRIKKKESSSAHRYHLVSKLRDLPPNGESSKETSLGIYDVQPMESELESHLLPCTSRGVVTCNSSIMCRESVTAPEDYVYDIYCGDGALGPGNLDWESIRAVQYVHDVVDSDSECYDDEDDSNDENNWRNDYPDEEDYDSRSSIESIDGLSYRHTKAYYYDSGNLTTYPLEYEDYSD